MLEEDMAAHFAGQRAINLFHLGLDQAVAGFPHQRRAAQLADAIKQRLAGLHIGNDRRAGQGGQHRLRQYGHQLIAPHHAAQPIDSADPVRIAIKGHAKITALLGHHALQIGQIGLNRGIGVMIGEIAVHIREQQMMGAGQDACQLFHHRPGNAIAAIPGNVERLPAKIAGQRRDIAVHDVQRAATAVSGFPITGRCHFAHAANIGAVKGPILQHHLAAVPVGRIVAAGHHQAGIGIQFKHAEIQHRRGAQADFDHIAARRHQAARHRRRQQRRRHAAIAAQRDHTPTAAPHRRAKAAANGLRIRFGQAVAHDAANVIFAQSGRMKFVGHDDPR